VVSVTWEEWCRGNPGDTTVTLRIPGAGALRDLDLFGGGYPGCIFEGREKSVLRVSPVTVVDSSGQKLR
jgi:hypothetical protein